MLASVFALLGATVPVATAAPPAACANRSNNTIAKLLECVDVAGVREHQAEFQAIADANGGNRTSGTPGYDASAAYVVERMEAAGYQVTLDEFPFSFFRPPLCNRRHRSRQPTRPVFTGSSFGTVAGSVIPVDINLAPPRDPVTSGCEATDFGNFSGPADIALIQRGTCTFAVKALNAQAAGAEAVIIFNQGNTPAREPLIVGTLA